jgi:hypothetical protein
MALMVTEITKYSLDKLQTFEQTIDSRLLEQMKRDPLLKEFAIEISDIPEPYIEALTPKYKLAGWAELTKEGNVLKMSHTFNVRHIIDIICPAVEIEKVRKARNVKVEAQ